MSEQQELSTGGWIVVWAVIIVIGLLLAWAKDNYNRSIVRDELERFHREHRND